jgi:hypothetical protein
MRRSPRGVARRRRGGATGSALAVAAAFVTLTTVAVVVGPAYLRADESPPADEPAALERHQQIIDALAALMSRSTEIIAIHASTDSSYTEIVLWLDDRTAPGRIDPGEIAVLTHSAVLHTIWFHTLEPAVDDPDDVLTKLTNEAASLEPLEWSDMQDAGFCSAWRHRPDIQRRLIASGVARLDVERIARSDNRSVLLRIALTWAAESADGPDRASSVLDVIMRRDADA